MNKTQNIRIEAFDYSLPDERIAKFPLDQRDTSKLLISKNNELSESTFNRLSDYLPDDSLLIFNNTKVIQARLIFQKETGAQIEIFCLEPKSPADYAQSFAQTGECTWLCLIGNLKRWKSGILSCKVNSFELHAQRIESYGDSHLIRFFWNNPIVCFADILDSCGELPIPPYLNRKTETSDLETYQTVYSKIKGSVAAPTAGLHFTDRVFESLKKKNIDVAELTLHVGAGTFKPVKTETIAEHIMHSECFTIKRSTIQRILENSGQVIAVGTTSVRTLESLYYIGVILGKNPNALAEDLEINQWMPYQEDMNILPIKDALQNILAYMDSHSTQSLTTHTRILIAPGYQFRIVDGIITNFHQPKSTLLLLISAFLDGNWQAVYDYALNYNFRFLSYGDSSLLLK